MAKQMRCMTISMADNGGHTVRHEYKSEPVHRRGGADSGMGMEHHPSEEHVFGPSEHGKMISHMTSHLTLGKKIDNADPEDGGN